MKNWEKRSKPVTITMSNGEYEKYLRLMHQLGHRSFSELIRMALKDRAEKFETIERELEVTRRFGITVDSWKKMVSNKEIVDRAIEEIE